MMSLGFTSIKGSLRRMLRRAERRIVERPFTDAAGEKGGWALIARALPHRVVKHRVALDASMTTERPLRIAFVSDLHVGSHADDVSRLGRIVEDVNDLAPDLVCLGGDYVNGMLFGRGRVPPRVTAGVLSALRPPLGTFAILGDHDELFGSSQIVEALREAGLSVLANEAREVSFGGRPISLVGVTPDALQLEELLRHLTGAPALVLAHDPSAFLRLPHGPYLMLCGHTHGGQISLPGLGPLVNMSEAPLRWTYGMIREGKRTLYVTSGIGTSGLPWRIGVPPEIALLEVSFGDQEHKDRIGGGVPAKSAVNGSATGVGVDFARPQNGNSSDGET